MDCADDHYIFFVSRTLITASSRAASTLLAVVALIAPMIVLSYVTSTASRIWIIAIFALAFSAGLSWLTRSRQYEIFSATAA